MIKQYHSKRAARLYAARRVLGLGTWRSGFCAQEQGDRVARFVVKCGENTYNTCMEFVREICAALGADALRLRYTIVSGKGAYFQNVYRLAAFSETEIIVRSRRETYLVSGASLSLGKYEAGDLVIFGDIVRVERQGVQV